MNPLRLVVTSLVLLVGLFFYAGCRTSATVSNRLLFVMLGPDGFESIQVWAGRLFSPVAWLHGALPSLLWVLVVTTLIGGWRLSLGARKHYRLSLHWLPLLTNAAWEAVQALHFTDGAADAGDVWAGVCGGLIGIVLFYSEPQQELAEADARSLKVMVVLAGFACMALADVWA